MKVVVLGGNGELGSYLCPKLAELGHEVVAVSNDDRAPYTPSAPEWERIKSVVHDRTAPGSTQEYSRAIAALAGEVVIDACCYEDEDSKAVVDALQGSSSLCHFVHCGSLRAYNPTVQRPWSEDSSRGIPCGYYTLQQQQMEARLLHAHKDAAFPATVLLMGDLVGEGWCPLTFQGLYDPVCFVALKQGKWVMVPEQKALVQVLDVHDAVAAVCSVLNRRDAAVGETYNLCTFPLYLTDYATGVAARNEWPAVELRKRPWMDFSYAVDKASLHKSPDNWLAPEAADSLWRNTVAANTKACEALSVTFRPPIESLAGVAAWCADNASSAARPRHPPVPAVCGAGRLEPFVPATAYAGPRAGYIFKNGRDGKGYYLDLGPYVDWQQATWRRIHKSHSQGPEGDLSKYDNLLPKVVVLYGIMFLTLIWSLVFTESGQGHLVYMAVVSTHFTSVPRLVPKPFTVSLMVEGDAGEEIAVWHDLLPNKGYKGKYSAAELAGAADKCRTVIYLHGNAENRNKQVWKHAWYAEQADANVVAFDYRGFGNSKCPPVAFQTCPVEVDIYSDAWRVLQLVTNSTEDGGFGVPSSCVVLHGHSLGSAVAVRVAEVATRMGAPVGGLVLESGFSSTVEMALTSAFSPLSYLPDGMQTSAKEFVRTRLKHKFDAVNYIADVASPVLLLHGSEDSIVPSSHTTTLYAAREKGLSGDAAKCQDADADLSCSDLHFVDQAGHQDVLRDEEAQQKILAFTNHVWRVARSEHSARRRVRK